MEGGVHDALRVLVISALSLSLARGFGGVVATCCLCDDVLGLVIISALSLSLARGFGGGVATGCLCDEPAPLCKLHHA